MEQLPDFSLQASFRTSADAPDQVFIIDGLLSGGDATSAWSSEYDDFDGTPALLRYPIDGSAPQTVALGVTFDSSAGSQTLDYTGGGPLVIGDGIVAKLWFVPNKDDPEVQDLVMQASPIP